MKQNGRDIIHVHIAIKLKVWKVVNTNEKSIIINSSNYMFSYSVPGNYCWNVIFDCWNNKYSAKLYYIPISNNSFDVRNGYSDSNTSIWWMPYFMDTS